MTRPRTVPRTGARFTLMEGGGGAKWGGYYTEILHGTGKGMCCKTIGVIRHAHGRRTVGLQDEDEDEDEDEEVELAGEQQGRQETTSGTRSEGSKDRQILTPWSWWTVPEEGIAILWRRAGQTKKSTVGINNRQDLKYVCSQPVSGLLRALLP
eukprot:661871-Hanusia_phi.AAC.1